MKIEPNETIKSWVNNHLHQVYWHALPKWVQFVVFIDRGLFNGYIKKDFRRIFCWFGFHKWNSHKYMIWENQQKTNKYDMQCRRCCMMSKIYE